jgi:hypothetical protein
MPQGLENVMNAYPRKLARILAIGALACMAGALSPAFAQGHGGGGGGHSSSGGGGGGGHSSGGGGGHANYAVGGSHFAGSFRGGGFSHGSAFYAGGGFYGRGFYGRDGFWHGGFFRGGCCFGPRFGFGFFLPVLPAFYATYWWGGVPYYYANDVYYTYNPDYEGYVATDPPPVTESAAPAAGAGPAAGPPPSDGGAAPGQIFMYPKNGQSAEQQATDKAECQQWAQQQAGQVAQNGSDYQRAMTACVEGRGYSAR